MNLKEAKKIRKYISKKVKIVVRRKPRYIPMPIWRWMVYTVLDISTDT